MKAKLIRTTLLLISIFSMGLHAKDIDQTFSAKNGGLLDLRTDAGSIRINTHNDESILVNVEIDGKQADEFEVTFEEDNGNLTIVGEKNNGSNGWSWNNYLKVKFKITVPENYNLELDTSGGSISIDDLTGNVNAETSGGSIKIGNIIGDVDVRTSGGSISSEDIEGHVNASTSGGSIKVTITKPLTEDAKLTTSGGSIKANIHGDSKLDLAASTSGGRVRTDFDVDGKVTKRSIKGKINGGGPKLTLRTSGGSVTISEI